MGNELHIYIYKPFTPDSGADSQPSFCNILGNPGNPDHMISNVVDDVEDCLQMAPFSWCFGVLKAIKSEKIKQNKTKRACIGTPRQNGARRFTTEMK